MIFLLFMIYLVSSLEFTYLVSHNNGARTVSVSKLNVCTESIDFDDDGNEIEIYMKYQIIPQNETYYQMCIYRDKHCEKQTHCIDIPFIGNDNYPPKYLSFENSLPCYVAKSIPSKDVKCNDVDPFQFQLYLCGCFGNDEDDAYYKHVIENNKLYTKKFIDPECSLQSLFDEDEEYIEIDDYLEPDFIGNCNECNVEESYGMTFNKRYIDCKNNIIIPEEIYGRG